MAMASMSLFLCLPGRVTQPIGSAEIPRPEIPWSKVAALPAAVFPGIDISQRLHGRLSLNDWVRTYTCWVCVCVYYMGMGIYGYGYIYIHTHIYIYIWCIYIYIYGIIWEIIDENSLLQSDGSRGWYGYIKYFSTNPHFWCGLATSATRTRISVTVPSSPGSLPWFLWPWDKKMD